MHACDSDNYKFLDNTNKFRRSPGVRTHESLLYFEKDIEQIIFQCHLIR